MLPTNLNTYVMQFTKRIGSFRYIFFPVIKCALSTGDIKSWTSGGRYSHAMTAFMPWLHLQTLFISSLLWAYWKIRSRSVKGLAIQTNLVCKRFGHMGIVFNVKIILSVPKFNPEAHLLLSSYSECSTLCAFSPVRYYYSYGYINFLKNCSSQSGQQPLDMTSLDS